MGKGIPSLLCRPQVVNLSCGSKLIGPDGFNRMGALSSKAHMAAQKSMLNEFPWDDRYRVSGIDDVLTPALVVYPDFVASNIVQTLGLLGGDADRWRVHIKTAKLGYTLHMLVERGVTNFKCATTLELLTACRNGAEDVLVAYPMVGANARRVREIAEQFRNVRIAALVENREQLVRWQGSPVGIFIDINPRSEE